MITLFEDNWPEEGVHIRNDYGQPSGSAKFLAVSGGGLPIAVVPGL